MGHAEASRYEVREEFQTGLATLVVLDSEHACWVLSDVILESNHNWCNVFKTEATVGVPVGSSADVEQLRIELPHCGRDATSALRCVFWSPEAVIKD
jgi:hypothetical protein